MPAVSLVVCVYRERALLERLLREAAGLWDDLVVVHDGPEEGSAAPAQPPALDYASEPMERFSSTYPEPSGPATTGSIHALVRSHGGRFFEGGRCRQQEPHWPFAWRQARHDWILRLDADEFPSAEMKAWLQTFRTAPEGGPEVSGYTCLWPLWDGRRAVTDRWPPGRHFLFHRQRVRFFGMVEQVPIADLEYQPLDLVLHHQPTRKSHGVRNILFRQQAYAWRRVIADSLLRRPTDLPRWRWEARDWPEMWQHLRRHPLRHSVSSLLRFPLRQARSMRAARQRPILSACLNPGLHHFMLGLQVFAARQRRSGPLP